MNINYITLNKTETFIMQLCHSRDAMENDASEVSKYQLISQPKLDKFHLQSYNVTANVWSDGHSFPLSNKDVCISNMMQDLIKTTHIATTTRKLSYRKDDRAMRPIYGCPENFRESPTATLAEIYNGLLFWSIPWMCVQSLKFVSLPIPEIIGGTQKIWAVPGYAHAPFSPKFLMHFCFCGPCECIGQICSPRLYPS